MKEKIHHTVYGANDDMSPIRVFWKVRSKRGGWIWASDIDDIMFHENRDFSQAIFKSCWGELKDVMQRSMK